MSSFMITNLRSERSFRSCACTYASATAVSAHPSPSNTDAAVDPALASPSGSHAPELAPGAAPGLSGPGPDPTPLLGHDATSLTNTARSTGSIACAEMSLLDLQFTPRSPVGAYQSPFKNSVVPAASTQVVRRHYHVACVAL